MLDEFNDCGMMLIFFDTEFTELGIDPRLISIGMVSDDGREFYAELSDTYAIDDCSDFVRVAVLPHLQGNDALMTMEELGTKLHEWIEGFDVAVTLATDSLSWDWPWIFEIFHKDGSWPVNLDGKPMVINQTHVFNLAVENAFKAGLRRHHALDDAKANRLGWVESQVKSAMGFIIFYEIKVSSNGELISIGLAAEDGRTFYGEICEAIDSNQLVENVRRWITGFLDSAFLVSCDRTEVGYSAFYDAFKSSWPVNALSNVASNLPHKIHVSDSNCHGSDYATAHMIAWFEVKRQSFLRRLGEFS